MISLRDRPRQVHYRPYEDEPTACGNWYPNYDTDKQEEVTCEDCKYEIR